jgi:FtsP/CotA-like multicopper oxidase with cupredoxin domain
MDKISRRQVIGGALAAGLLPVVPRPAFAVGKPAKRLLAGTTTIEVNGKAANVFRLTDAAGRSGITLAPDERFHVDLVNECGRETIIHWHGQLPPWTQDGFPWPQTPPLAPAAVKSYNYAPIPGTFWMHSHQGLQEQRLMTAPLIVHDAATVREDRQEVVLMLHDFSFKMPDELLAGLTGKTLASVHAMVRQTENVPAPGSNASGQTQSSGMQGMTMGGMPSMGGMTMSGAAPDLSDTDYDAFLANERTLADPEIVQVGRAGQVRLRIINGASSSQFWIDLGTLSGRIVAVDGHPVRPVAGTRFPIAMAQRLDILVDLPDCGAFPILARLEGSRRRTGIVLATPRARITRIDETGLDTAPPADNSLETRLSAITPLASRKPDLVHRIVLAGKMKPYAWSLNGAFWPHIEPLMLTRGQRVEIEITNTSTMAHPMHLHGHVFQVIAVNGRPINGAIRDTVLVTPKGSVRIAFDADNPGRWAFHCHNLYHMMTGMMTEFRYRDIAV